jgi:ABC-2 type transport system permease protein
MGRAITSPSFLAHLWLLWRLRVQIALNRRQHRVLAVAAFGLSIVPAVMLGASFYALLRLEWVAESEVWPAFILNLLCFVTSAVWCIWPVLSAGVDDHSELSRYAAFPISRFRLLFASTLASVFEPRILFFFAPVVGASLGYAATHEVRSRPVAVGLLVLFALLNAAWSRVGLHVVLNVLRAHRNAELLGGFFALFLLACSFIPPIDASWLFAVATNAGALDLTVLINAAVALGRVPPGFYGSALLHLGHGDLAGAVWRGVGMLIFMGVGFTIAYVLLARFYEGAGRSGGAAGLTEQRNPFARTAETFTTLVVREALDLWKNPRARLLASVPFVLAILLKLLSGRDLFVFLAGRTADAWVLGALASYGAVVMASTFSQNMFAYDGHGFSLLLTAPVKLEAVMRAKNAVHAGAAFLLAGLVGAFYAAYFRTASVLDVAVAMASVAALVPVVLAAGNFLSVVFPVKFHASLKRRDKLPFAASMLGVGAASLGCLPMTLALRFQVQEGPDLGTLGMIVASAALAWMAYRLTFPTAAARLVAHRERVLTAVTRD